jgi:predicted nuclease of predicted toxin-antitoxin system
LRIKPSELTKYVKKAIVLVDSCCPQKVCAVLEEIWDEEGKDWADYVTYNQVDKEILNYEKEGC